MAISRGLIEKFHKGHGERPREALAAAEKFGGDSAVTRAEYSSRGGTKKNDGR